MRRADSVVARPCGSGGRRGNRRRARPDVDGIIGSDRPAGRPGATVEVGVPPFRKKESVLFGA